MNMPPIDASDESNVVDLPVSFKPPADDGPYLVKSTLGCKHRAGFILDTTLTTVECKTCHEKLNPMFVLRELATSETQWHRQKVEFDAAVERFKERSRTTCEHCGKMTRISSISKN